MQRSRKISRKIASAAIEVLEGRRLLSSGGDVVGLTTDNMLVTFDSDRPDKVSKAQAIGGLAAGEEVVGIDYRPATGGLYGLVDGPGGADRIILINSKSGASSNVFNLTTPLVGDEFGVDFNPVADALRIVSDADQNLRVPFATGATIVDGPLAYGANDFNAGANPNVVGAAYTNSFPGTTATVLYDIDSANDFLSIQTPPNAGTLMSRGPLGVDAGPLLGFDIRAADSNATYKGQALVSVKRAADAGSRLYDIDLATGGVRDIGAIGNAKKGLVTLRDITLTPDIARKGNGGSEWGNDRDKSDKDNDRDRRRNDDDHVC